MLVLAIILLLTVAAFIIYPRVKANNAARQDIAQLTSITSEIQTTFSRKSLRYANISTVNLDKMGIVDTSSSPMPSIALLKSENAQVGFSPFLGGRGYIMAVRFVPSKVCPRFLTELEQQFDIIYIGMYGPQKSAGNPLTPDEIMTGCDDHTNALYNNNVISFVKLG